MTERRETFEPWTCRECGYTGLAFEEVLKDRVPYGSGSALLERFGEVTCACCGSNNIKEVGE